jgi:hypothetical protein
VPFVATGATGRFPLRRGDLLVCRCDEQTVRAGQTDPREILSYLAQGVEVHAVSNLHAKVFVVGRIAIVGSSNLSGSSEEDLVEAAIETSAPPLVGACRAFVDSLRGDQIGDAYAKRLAALYKPPRKAPRRGRNRKKVIRHSELVAVRLDRGEFDDADTRAEHVAKEAGATRIKDHDRFKQETFKWSGSLPRGVRLGARVLQMVRDGSHAIVEPPGRVLAIRRYRSPRGGFRVIVSIESPKRVRARRLADVLGKLGAAGRRLRGIKNARHIPDPQLIYHLGRLWST